MECEDEGRPATAAEAPVQAADEAPEFGYAEHLLLWSWRRLARGSDDVRTIAAEFAAAFGADSGEVLAAFDTFLRALTEASRRPLVLGRPGNPAVTEDERQVLSLIAAAQAERPALFTAHLRWLAAPQRHDALRIAASALATALTVNDLRLAPPPEAATVCARDGV